MARPAGRLGHQQAPLTCLLAAYPVLLPRALTDQVASRASIRQREGWVVRHEHMTVATTDRSEQHLVVP